MHKLASAATLVVLLAAGCGSTTGVAGTSVVRTVTVYEYQLAGSHFRLYPAQVTADDTGDAATDAVGALLQHEPARAWLHTTWHGGNCAPASEVSAVRQSPDLITVDLVETDPAESGLAVCDMGEEGAAIQIQQMVWTVQRATGSNAPVQIMLGDRRFSPPTAADPRVVAPWPIRDDQTYRRPDAPGYR